MLDRALQHGLVQVVPSAFPGHTIDVDQRYREYPVPCPSRGHLAGSAREYPCAQSTCSGLHPSEEVVVDIRWGVAPLERQYRDDVAPRQARDTKEGVWPRRSTTSSWEWIGGVRRTWCAFSIASGAVSSSAACRTQAWHSTTWSTSSGPWLHRDRASSPSPSKCRGGLSSIPCSSTAFMCSRS